MAAEGEIGISIQSIVATVGTLLTLLVSMVVHLVAKKTDEVVTDIDALGRKVNDHGVRIAVIESNYVTREDIEHILETLQEDLKQGFTAANTRIDKLYRPACPIKDDNHA